MTLKVNFTNVSDRGPAKPNGWYQVRVTDGEVKEVGDKGKNPGQQYMTVELTIQKGEYSGQKFWTGMHLLNEKALGIVKGFLRATGRFSQAQLDGELMVRNKQREYEGDMNDNVSGYKSLESEKVNTGKASAGSSLMP
jgi:hypothetical protein